MSYLENLRKKLKAFFYLPGIPMSEAEQKKIFRQVEESSSGGLDYYLFVVLSSLIATLGLIINSVAVIIGAMVIAPLTYPIMGVAMGVVRSDISLLLKSLRSVLLGVLLVYIISFTLTKILPYVGITPEILARISPTLYDLIIGLAAGSAGAFALTRKSFALSLAGVAIAVSLIPPLATSGIGLALGNLKISYGAFILGVANLVAINLASIFTFYLEGFGSRRSSEGIKEFRRNLIISICLVLILAIPLSFFMYKTINHSILDDRINKVVKKVVPALDPEARLADLKWKEKNKDLEIEVAVYSPAEPKEEFMRKFHNLLQQETKRPLALTVRILWVAQHKKTSTSEELIERRRPYKDQFQESEKPEQL